MLAFWMGGAANPSGVAPPSITTIHGTDEQFEDARKRRRDRLLHEDDLMLETIMNAVARGMLH